jgi:hypothetical protein
VTDNATLHTPEATPSLPVEITLQDAKDLLARTVKEKGENYTYTTVDGECVYFDPATGCPSCMVGHVLSYKGITLKALELGEVSNTTDVADLVSGLVIEVDVETQYLLTLAQSNQDEGSTWGRALKTALEGYEEAAEYAAEDAEDYDLSQDYYL